MSELARLPAWIKRPVPDQASLAGMKQLFDGLHLHTVCESAQCPNQGVCFMQGTATFMILGDTCTRNCSFCAVGHGFPIPVDPSEPEHLVDAISKLRLRHVVITSVTRDDLEDGGASQFAACVEAIRRRDPLITVEVLIPDFRGKLSSLRRVLDSSPAVLNHNIETVPRLYPEVRPQARYGRSVELLMMAKAERPDILTKSGLMLGIGETREEVILVMEDIREAGWDILTIGQYLRPSPRHHEVV
ncbi:MAG: lipoyl synthase [Chloroflexi bacterium]|nr:lipoyl synthase [Chloroflexota bacterium]